jgi:hypothetical protein
MRPKGDFMGIQGPLMLRLLGLLPITICLLFQAGCNRSHLPKTVAIQGHVTYQGKPVTSGTVGFNPTNPSNRPAIGHIGSDGMYCLASFRTKDGVMPGEYKVTVQSFSSLPTPEDMKKPTVSRIPLRYANVKETNLSFTVPENASATLVYDIVLK